MRNRGRSVAEQKESRMSENRKKLQEFSVVYLAKTHCEFPRLKKEGIEDPESWILGRDIIGFHQNRGTGQETPIAFPSSCSDDTPFGHNTSIGSLYANIPPILPFDPDNLEIQIYINVTHSSHAYTSQKKGVPIFALKKWSSAWTRIGGGFLSSSLSTLISGAISGSPSMGGSITVALRKTEKRNSASASFRKSPLNQANSRVMLAQMINIISKRVELDPIEILFESGGKITTEEASNRIASILLIKILLLRPLSRILRSGIKEKVLNLDNAYRRQFIDQVVSTALPESKSPGQVFANVKAFMTANLPHELIKLLEKIVLQNSTFSRNFNLHNLLILTAIKADPSRVIVMLMNWIILMGLQIGEMVVEAQLYEGAFSIFKKFNLNVQAVNVLLDNVHSIDRAVEFAFRVKKMLFGVRLPRLNSRGKNLRVTSSFDSLDVGDLWLQTNYVEGYQGEHHVIEMFWEVLKGFSLENKRKFLKLVTGDSWGPLLGFRYLEPLFCIQRVEGIEETVERLPTSTTCMNLLKLPPYKSKGKTRQTKALVTLYHFTVHQFLMSLHM
ncbi:hypothetical protein VNO77_25963 [Canavalia gladiata]|uniref:HECT domain-containing protein n=1 Tax=Canavalia gladiata TaxID=3824 RepID=A0AAN9KSY4_CANGL